MKKIFQIALISILIILLSFHQSYCQKYHPILKDSSTWYVLHEGWGYTTESNCIKGEDTINEVVYKKYGYVDFGNINALVREDTIERKVYKWICGSEILLYDFSMKIGDSIFYKSFSNCNYITDVGWYKLDSIKPFILETSVRNAYYLTEVSLFLKHYISIS